MTNETFTYRFDIDRDYFIDFSMKYQKTLPFFTLLTIRPLIFLILMKKRDYMADIRIGYIINQITMTAQEFNFCFLFRVHDLAPYAGLYCDGPICRLGIPKHYLMMILSSTTIGALPTFFYLLLRMHQRIILTTDSRLKLSKSTQRAIVLLMTVFLVLNVAGFYEFGRDCTEADELEKVADLAWLKKRGGTLFLFGPPGEAQYFSSVTLLLFCSMMTISPFVVLATIHSMIIMNKEKAKKSLTSKTQRVQARIARVFFCQLMVVSCFFVLPLSLFMLHMIYDFSRLFPAWLIAVSRCILMIAFTLESTLLSLIFLLKNPGHRRIIKSALFGRSEVKHSISLMDRKITIPSTIKVDSSPHNRIKTK